eukprot:CAMPEP_0170605114 /NCGR_PEP_ID=MMETSP0224-20130122/19802_1 /TAXON_ID=285029 /ORGANISM="Togula jolla, Strain CCCM 725" /LENGTH=234 /DNA_ID=CAMNT_0010930099 /DNA_START=47 /DNA_END=752 /DNA_ORIENTATION=-
MIEQDSELREMEHLILKMEELEEKIHGKKEQQRWVAESIAEKQSQCQQLKEQHEEKIRSLAQKARRQRGRRKAPMGEDLRQLNLISIENTSPSSQQEGHAGGVPGADPTHELDSWLLDGALGTTEWQKLLVGGTCAAGNQAGTENSQAGLTALVETLSARRDLVRQLTTRLAEHVAVGCNAEGNARSGPAEGISLRQEISDFLKQQVTTARAGGYIAVWTGEGFLSALWSLVSP